MCPRARRSHQSGPFTTKGSNSQVIQDLEVSGGTITAEADGWLACVRLEDPPGLSPITTVGRFATVDEAQIATDEVWASR